MTRAVLGSQFSILGFSCRSQLFQFSAAKIRMDKLWVLSVCVCLSGEWFLLRTENRELRTCT